ncbi:MAG: hypothetical protein M3Q91_17805 [Acidobacteriota bacterium]|nr:hypothetical protein [Acidobacteriota bacterium]
MNQLLTLKAWKLIAGGNAPGKSKPFPTLKGSNLGEGKDGAPLNCFGLPAGNVCGIESFDPFRVGYFFFRLSVGVARRSPTAIEFIPFRDETFTPYSVN